MITSADSFASPVTTIGTLAGATAELNRFTSPCAGGSGEMNARPGVWYRLTGTGTRIHVDTCGSGFDSILMIFCGVCDGLTCVASNDDGAGLGGDDACATPTSESSLSFDSENGRTYYIWLADATSAAPAFVLNVNSAGPNLAAPLACLGCTYAVPLPDVTELEPCTIPNNNAASSNAGCDIAVPAFQDIGPIASGATRTVVGLAQASKRIDAPFTDIDWFTFTSPSGNFLRLEGRTSFPASIQVKDLGPSPGACPIASPDLAVLATTTCGEMFAADLKPVVGRTYAVRITHPSADTQGILCGPSAGYYFALSAGTAGACCDATTGVCTEVTFANCAAPNTFLAGTCAPNPCPQPTACCNTIDGTCTVAAPGALCPANSVAASPASSTCSGILCPQPTACCDAANGTCTVLPPGQLCTNAPVAAPVVLNYSGTIETWLVPISGTYRIEAIGANGGSSVLGAGGRGAVIQGDVALTGGGTLRVLVGGVGGGSNASTGGGGGSYVVENGTNVPLVIAGGGGGGGGNTPANGGPGLTGTSGGPGQSSAGMNGLGGGQDTDGGAGGGGLLGNGASSGAAAGGFAFVNGGAGGASPIASGGFGGGGGGGGNGSGSGSGGGGGYSGGGGGSSGDGGGSFLTASAVNAVLTEGGNSIAGGNGRVTITLLSLSSTCTPNPCPQPTACCNPATGACTLAAPGQACAAGSVAASPATSTCTPEPCPQPTACCDTTTGACILATPGQACGAGTTAAVPVATACGPNPCPQPIACCNDTTGACTAMLGGTCPAGTTASPAPTCTPNFCPIGACCDLVTGACTQRGPSGCAGPNQFYRGSGSDCAASPCPTGACCDLANLACTITGVNGCSAAGFTFRGPGTACNPSPCPSGACCDLANLACTLTGPIGCNNPGFTFLGVGSVCTPNTCPAGACCDLATLACELRGPLGCNGPNQVFRGVGTVCVPNACPSGACCNLTTLACTITGPLGCTEVFRGVNSVCMPSPCPSGACCNLVTGNCRITGPLGCDGVDEAFVGIASVCNSVTCVSGACCDTLGACTVTGVAGCAPPSTFLGTSTVCGPNACDPTACCNSTSGACTVAPAGSTCAAGSIPASPAATTCTAGLCPQPTACCDTTTGACSVALPAAACPAGTVASMASACAPGVCPQPTACCDTTTGACTVALPAQACGAGTVAASPTSSTCTAASCPQPRACCNTTTGGCVVALPGQLCPAGTFSGMIAVSSCAVAFCPQPLACCDTTTGACTVVPPGIVGAVCGAGTVAGAGNPSTCTPGLCPQPLACCNTTSGACTVVPPGVGGAVCAAGSVASPGNAATCTPGLCPQPIACCNFITGVCVVVPPGAGGAACAAGSAAAPGGAAACVPYPCPLIGSVGLACPDCTWVNGAFDGVSGQDSHLGGAIPLGAKAADDFFLCEDFIYDLQVISATLMTTTDPLWVKPIAEIYEDCNGCPGALLYRLDSALVVETGLTHSLAAPDGRPLRIVHASWSIDASQQIVNNRNIVLKGGRYWLSVYGRTDNFSLMTPPMYDVTYWGTTGNGALGVKGLPAKKITGQPTPVYNQFLFGAGCVPRGGAGPGWMSVTDGCCIGCTDLNFSVCTRPCKILIDNGPARNLPGVALGSTSQYAIGTNSPLETRSADDFVIPPCQAYTICYVEACVLTNCPTFEGVFELYTNDCHKPSYTLHGVPFGGNTYVATKVIDLGFVWTVGTAIYRAYKLEFHDLAIVVPGGTQMWISAGVRYTFSLTERAFFCYNEPCAPCDIKWNPGRVLTVSSLDLDPPLPGQQPRLGWAALVDDFSFLIAADGNTTPGPINADPPPAPSCAADFNRDGTLNVTDIFDYLTGWFAGCP